MGILDQVREDRRMVRQDLISASNEGKMSAEIVKEILESYDDKFLEMCKNLSEKDMDKFYELEKKRLEVYSHPKSFGLGSKV